ncbi:hypothetical protein GCM10023334_035560 [Nonomuraea thailandensis]
MLLAMASLLVLTLDTAAGSSRADAAPGPSFANPVVGTPNSADPTLLFHNGFYYYVATTWSANVVMRRSPTIAGLYSAPEQVVVQTGGNTMWAPHLEMINNRWYLYYSIEQGSLPRRTHVAESAGSDPMGPYTIRGVVNLMPNNGWAIDASVLKLNGNLYLTYSAFASDGLQSLFIAPMSNPWTASAHGRRISAPTLAWERQNGAVNEGSFPLQRNGRTFLTYSASHCNGPNYKLGMLEYRGGDPLAASSWSKFANPIFQRNDANGVYGPGHHSFFTSPDGTEAWIAYHANSSSTQGCGTTRTTRVQKISWNADGTPNLGVPVSTSTILAGPSGEPSGPSTTLNRLQSVNFPDRYVRHVDFDVRIDANVSPAADSQWRIVPGLADSSAVSFESSNYPGYYLRHFDYDFTLAQNDGSATFRADATFRRVAGLSDASAVSFQSFNFPDRYIRHADYLLRLDPISTAVDRADATFRVTN